MVGKAFPEAMKFLDKNPSVKGRLLLYELLVKETPKVPQTIQAITTAAGCVPELNGKSLLLKTAHTLFAVEGRQGLCSFPIG